MDAVEYSLENHDLSWWPNIHSLSHPNTNPLALSCINSIYPQRVILRVILKALDLECTIYDFFLNLRQAHCLFLNLAMTRPCDEVAGVEQVVDVPDVVSVFVKVQTNQEYFFLPVNDLLDDFHFFY